MARWIAAHAGTPALVLCSTATRTRETLDLALPHLTPGPAVHHDPGLYLASAEEMADLIRARGGADHPLMVVGHNPGTEDLADLLAGSGEPRGLETMRAKYPTAAAAVIDVPIDDWGRLEAKTGTLRWFMRPRDLPPQQE